MLELVLQKSVYSTRGDYFVGLKQALEWLLQNIYFRKRQNYSCQKDSSITLLQKTYITFSVDFMRI